MKQTVQYVKLASVGSIKDQNSLYVNITELRISEIETLFSDKHNFVLDKKNDDFAIKKYMSAF